MNPRQVWQRLRFLRALLLLAMVSVLAGLLAVPVGQAEQVKVGYRDFSFGSSPTKPTADKPQSKLWWNDGRWWGSLYEPSANDYTIHWLDLATQSWVDTGTLVDTRAGAHMDALWDGQKLYVVSGASALPAELRRFSYNPLTKQYSLDGGFPLTVRSGGGETITIAKDSTGKLWISYPQSKRVWVNRTIGSDTQWGQAFVPSVKGTSITSDDITAVIAFQGNKIGLMWSNQNDKKMYFAVHRDGDTDTTWQATQTALPGPNQSTNDRWADDHINLKQVTVDGSGRVFAAIKTSLTQSNAPLVMLLVRDLSGNWSSYVFGRYQDQHTRPIVLIDEEHAQLYMFATAPEGGGVIYYKTTPLNNVAFPMGLGTPFIQSDTDRDINDATSTKQNLNSTTGLLVLASDDSSNRYLHNYLSLGGAVPPTPTPTPTPTPSGDTGPITLRSTSTAETTTASPTSLSVSVPAGVQNGDVLVAHVALRGGSGQSVTPPGGWTLIRADASSSSVWSGLYYRVAQNEPGSYTWSWSSAAAGAIGIAAYTGVDLANPLDGSSGKVNTGTAVTAPSVTTTVANDQLLYFATAAGGTSVTPPPGMTERWDHRSTGASSNVAGELADRALSSAGATGDQTGTVGFSTTTVGQLVALRPSGLSMAPSPTPTETATGGGDAIVLRGTSTAETATTSPTSLSVDVPADVQSDDVLIAHLALRGGRGQAVAAPTGWTLVRTDASSSSVWSGVYYRVADGEPASYTWSWSPAAAGVIGVVAYAGVDLANPVDVSSGRVNSGTTAVTAPSIQSETENGQLLYLAAVAGSTDVAPPAGMAERWDHRSTEASGNVTGELADQALSAAGATGDRTGTAGFSTTSVGHLVALRADAGG